MTSLLYRAVASRKNVIRRVVYNDAVRQNSNKCMTSKQMRTTYPRMYKTLLVRPDGSTVTIRYKEPIKMIMMPIDVVRLSEAERTKLWLSRQKKVESQFLEEIEDSFKVDDYKHLWK